MPADLNELKRLHAAADTGEMKVDGSLVYSLLIGENDVWFGVYRTASGEKDRHEVAKYVAELMNAFPALAAELEELRNYRDEKLKAQELVDPALEATDRGDFVAAKQLLDEASKILDEDQPDLLLARSFLNFMETPLIEVSEKDRAAIRADAFREAAGVVEFASVQIPCSVIDPDHWKNAVELLKRMAEAEEEKNGNG